MSNRVILGAFPPPNSRYWRIPAHSRLAGGMPFVCREKACERDLTEPLPQVICGAVYHFRTPSPGGQRISQDVMLPTFFLCQRKKMRDDVTACHAIAFDCVRPDRFILDRSVPNSNPEIEKEPIPCHLNLPLLPLSQRLGWPLAAIPLVNRRYRVLSSAPQVQPSLTVTLARVLLSAPSAELPIVRSTTRRAATDYRQSRANGRLFRRRDAHSSPSNRGSLIRDRVCHITKVSNKGRPTCVLNPLFLSRPQPSDWRHVVTLSVSRLFSAVPPVVSEARCSEVTRLQAQPLVPAPTCFTATNTQAAAKALPRHARNFRSHAERRPVFGQGGVLRSRTQRSEAPCSRNY